MTAARVQMTSGVIQEVPSAGSCAHLLCARRRAVGLPSPTEVFWTCHLHALSTEVEEVMGLLLGDVLVSEAVCCILQRWQK